MSECCGSDLGFVLASNQDLHERITVENIRNSDTQMTGAHRWITPELLVGKLSVPPYLTDAISTRSDVYSDSAPPATTGAAGWES